MSKLFKEANEWWWVPKSAPLELAVRINSPEEYPQAVLEKVQGLVDKEGGQALALKLANQVRQERGFDPVDPGDKTLAQVLVESSPLEQAVWEHSPEQDQLANPEMCREAISEQKDLDLQAMLLL